MKKLKKKSVWTNPHPILVIREDLGIDENKSEWKSPERCKLHQESVALLQHCCKFLTLSLPVKKTSYGYRFREI